MLITKDAKVSFIFVCFASLIFPAPNRPPTIIDIAVPKDMVETLKRFEIVDVMLVAATTSRPRNE